MERSKLIKKEFVMGDKAIKIDIGLSEKAAPLSQRACPACSPTATRCT
jgi:hypothetical protein